MKQEIHKYPYNLTIEDETKIFFSDQVCESIVSVSYAAFIFGALFVFGMPKAARSIGVTPIIVSSASEIHRAAPQHFHQHAPCSNS